jgi:hypothetical protein
MRVKELPVWVPEQQPAGGHLGGEVRQQVVVGGDRERLLLALGDDQLAAAADRDARDAVDRARLGRNPPRADLPAGAQQ